MNILELFELSTGYWKSATISAAVEIGIFDELAREAQSAEQIAGRLQSSVPHIMALLDSLTGIGIMKKYDSLYSIHPELSHILDPQSPDSLIPALKFNFDLYPLWGQLSECVKSGTPVVPPGEHLGANPQRTHRFVMGMHSRARAFVPTLLSVLALDGRTHLLDVASGSGTFSAALAEQHDRLRVSLFDLPPIMKVARQLQSSSPAAERLTFLEGDYKQDPFPSDCDAALFCGALHQEEKETAALILEKIYHALQPGGVFYLIDLFLDRQRTHPAFSALFSINMMLVSQHGSVYTYEDAEQLVSGAGFTDVSCEQLKQAPYGLIKSVKSG